VFTARYALSPYIKQIRFVFKGFMNMENECQASSLYTYSYIGMYVCMYVCMYYVFNVCIMYVCMYVCMYVLCMYVLCMYVCVCVYVSE
jgi:hypothetical protein